MSSSFLTLILIIMVPYTFISVPSSFVLQVNAQPIPSYEECAPSNCGKSTIQYPLGSCGPLYASCNDYHAILFTILLNFSSLSCRVIGDITISSYSTGTLQIAQVNIGKDRAGIIDSSAGFFNLAPGYMVGTIVNCTQKPADILINNVKLLDCTESNRYCFFYPEAGFQVPSCDNYPLAVPTKKSYNISADKNFELLKKMGFKITWSTPDVCHVCQATGGRCSTDGYCICQSNVYRQYCPDGEYRLNSFIDRIGFPDLY